MDRLESVSQRSSTDFASIDCSRGFSFFRLQWRQSIEEEMFHKFTNERCSSIRLHIFLSIPHQGLSNKTRFSSSVW